MAERNNNEGDGGVNQREPLSSSFAPPNTDDRGRGGGEEAPTANEHPHPHGFNNAPMPSVFPRYTVHTYHDYSTFIEEGGVITKHKKSGRNFPARLHAILSNEQYSHIISWMPHGRAWKVHKKDLLVRDVLPKYFGQSHYTSFTRQLNGWGFKRLHQTGADHGCYYHECFIRGHPRLTPLMRRVSGGQGKATPNANAEPDFDDIAKKYPLRPAEETAPQGKAVMVVKKAEVHFHDYDHRPLNFLGDSDLGKEASTSKNEEDAPILLLGRATYASKKDAEATFSDHKKTDFLGDFDVGEESSVTNGDSIPFLEGKPPARDSESPNTNTSQDHVWDPLPFQPTHPPLHEAATNPYYDGNNTHPAKQLSQMFPHAPYHYQYQYQYQQPNTNQYFGSNINQYASSTPHLGSAGFHYPFPTKKLDSSNNSNNNSAFGHYHHGHDHQYYSNSSYGHGYSNQFEYPGYEQQPHGDGTSLPPPPPQMNYPARVQSLPNFSPMKSNFEGKSEKARRSHESIEVDESQGSQLPPG